jgi:hypothetical protein
METEIQRPRLNRTPLAKAKPGQVPSTPNERKETDPPENWIIRRLLALRREAEEEARMDYWGNDDEVIEQECFTARARVTTEFLREVKAAEEYAKRHFRGEIWIKDNHYPNKILSLLQDRRVEGNVRRFPRLWDILNFNDRLSEKTKKDKTQEPIECRTKNGGKDKRYRSYFLVDKKYYGKAEQELGLKRPTMTKYLQALTAYGFYQRKLRINPKAMEYKDGMWQIFPNGNWRKLRLFKCNAAGRRALCEFSLSYTGR